jgi:hypothetical protein
VDRSYQYQDFVEEGFASHQFSHISIPRKDYLCIAYADYPISQPHSTELNYWKIDERRKEKDNYRVVKAVSMNSTKM